MILEGELTPIGKLSGAFLSPKTPMHIQFAYYQSSLVAEYLADQFGWETMLAILRDLGDGMTINAALAAHTLPLEQLEQKFDAYARQLALNLAQGLDWERPPGFKSEAPHSGPARSERFTERYGVNLVRVFEEPASPVTWTDARLATNFWALRKKAETVIDAGQWTEAKNVLELLIREYPDQRGPDTAHALLASVHRTLNEPELERAALERWAELDSDALDAYQRLMVLSAADDDWEGVMLNANRFLAVNPLLPQPFLYLAEAAERLAQPESAIQSWQKVLAAGPPDPTEAHFRLAKLLHQHDDPGARRHVLEALERAPRFRAAHVLLLDLQSAPEQPDAPAAGDHQPAVPDEAASHP
jgi:tetratricopeptide (TPR) repeat protein